MGFTGIMRTLLVTLALVALPALAADVDPKAWHRVVGLLEYLEGDYAMALSTGDAEELEEQRGFADEVVKQLEQLGAPGAAYLEAARALQAAIVASASADDVVPRCGELARRIVKEQALVQAPKRAPSLAAGKASYEAQCASCHGVTGAADTEAAKALTPPPANFLDEQRMAALTPYKVFNTTTFGIQGTGMPGFPQLSDEERWAQAFHIFTLRQPPCTTKPPAASLAELATSTDEQLATKYGPEAVACLRRALPKDDESTLAIARAGLDEALRRSAQGDWTGARQAVVDAYLNGLEPMEPTLRARDAKLVERLEAGFTQARLAAQAGRHFEAEARALQALLEEAEARRGGSSFWSVFIAAFFILLREGFEAVVVVGALLAVLKKMNATSQARVVHLGWVSALVAGAAAFVFGQAFFAGANREWLEAIVALVAVGLLLYAALWLNARANMSRFMTEMRGQVTEALGAGSTFGLFTIAFTSVGRESLETALFLQGLAGDSRDGVAWGAGAGLVALLALVAVVRTVGFRLPMKTLFSASTVLLVATAVMLLGKGLHGLQEVGVLPLAPIPFLKLEVLGIYPDALTLVPQLLLSLAPFAWRALARRGGSPAATSAG